MSDGKIAADLFIYAVVSVVPHHGCRPKTQASSEADSLKIETYTWKHRYQDQATTFAVRCNQNNMAYDMARKHGKKAWQRCKKSSDLGSRRVSGIRTREFRPGTPSIGDTKKAEQSLFGRLLAGGGDSPISTDDELKALATSINAGIDRLAIYTQRKPPDRKVVLPSLLEDSGISKEAMCHVLWKLNTELSQMENMEIGGNDVLAIEVNESVPTPTVNESVPTPTPVDGIRAKKRAHIMSLSSHIV
jgi:hypothetical protein